jgi:endogenous inhibitor of DNA gyrase (YacG/DUF329 family)
VTQVCTYCDKRIKMMCQRGTGFCSVKCEKAHDPEAWAEKTKRQPL